MSHQYNDLIDIARPVILRKIAGAPKSVRHQIRRILEDALAVHAWALDGSVTISGRATEMMRAAGREWAATGRSCDDIAAALGDLTVALVTGVARDARVAEPMALGRIVSTSNIMMREFVLAWREANDATPVPRLANAYRTLAIDLLNGYRQAEYGNIPVVETYAVVAVHCTEPIPVAEMATIAKRCGGDGACAWLTDNGGAVLLPATHGPRARTLASDLYEALGAACWLAYTWRPTPKIPLAWHEVSRVLSLALGARRPTGVYCFDDVLVEYAAAQHSEVSASMAMAIEALVAQPTLLNTLTALIDADGNRSRAAQQLIVHRSTMDYRLSRISQVTGHDPATSYGLQTLAIALTLHTMANCPSPLESV
jgi:PucR C-terminal helix-turn-helix domain